MLLLYAFLGTCLRSSEIDTGIGERCAFVLFVAEKWQDVYRADVTDVLQIVGSLV